MCFYTCSGKTAALFKHHSGPITSVEWHPTDSSVFAASGEDNQVQNCFGVSGSSRHSSFY
jgi:WD40 repeat protein